MLTSAERLLTGKTQLKFPVNDMSIGEHDRAPEWHSLRLLGRGRRPGTVESGATVHKKL